MGDLQHLRLMALLRQLVREKGPRGAAAVLDIDHRTLIASMEGNVSKTGAIYVFTKPSDGDWTSTITETKLTATGGAADDLFGASVALYGASTIVVGAPGDQNSVGGINVSTGSAYVFARDSNGDWSQKAKLTASNAATGRPVRNRAGAGR